jgi:predicted NUDIX family NTP pyrophosphohydrolase
MTALSAGILLYRGTVGAGAEVWLGHMGGPFWSKKEERAWSIPKGEITAGEDRLAGALREFAEEMGVPAPDLDYLPLGMFTYSSGKRVTVFAGEAPAFGPGEIRSNTFELEWPPRSGQLRQFPEMDRARWVPLPEARELLVAGQVPVIDALEALLAS